MSCWGRCWGAGTAVDTSPANTGLGPKVGGALEAVDGLKRLPTEPSTRAGVSLDLVGYSKNSLGNSSKNHPKVAESLEAMQQAGLPTHINVSWCEPAELVKDVHELRWAGQGSQGVVYEGIWQGALVAVKWSLAEQLDTGACELLFSRLLGHPNVVQTYDAKVAILDNQIFEQDISSSSSSSILRSAGSSSGTGGRNPSQTTPTIMESQDLVDARSESYKSEEGFGNPFGRNSGLTDVRDMLRLMGAKPGQCITQMIMEYCDQGSLLTAISRGIFLPTSRFGQKVALRALFRTAREISQGMTHLHQAHVVHGDLKPANVLLMNSRKDRRGFIAKISDFGLAQYCPASRGVVENAPWGTLVFMAPERFSTNRLEPASDVWSFGVLMWQMYTARMPYEGTTQNKLLHGVSNGTLHLTWPSGSPTSLVTLVASCMARQPSARPSFEQLIHQLATLESDVRMEGFRLSNSIDNPRQSSSHERPGNLADSTLQKKSSGLQRKHSTKNAPSAQLEIECPVPVPLPAAVDAAQQWAQNPLRTTPAGASLSPRSHHASTAATQAVLGPQMPRIATGTTAAQRQQAALAVLQSQSSQPGTPPQQVPHASNNSSSNNTGGGASSQPSHQYRAAHPTTSALMSASTSANTCEGSLGSMAWSAATGTVGNSSPGRNNSSLGPGQGSLWTGSAINERLSMDRRSQSRSIDMDMGLSAGGAALISPDPDFSASRFAVADAAQEAVGSWSSATPVPCPSAQQIGGWTTSTQAKRAQAMSRLRHTSEEWDARKPQ